MPSAMGARALGGTTDGPLATPSCSLPQAHFGAAIFELRAPLSVPRAGNCDVGLEEAPFSPRGQSERS